MPWRMQVQHLLCERISIYRVLLRMNIVLDTNTEKLIEFQPICHGSRCIGFSV